MHKTIKILAILIILITLQGVNQFSSFTIGDGIWYWIIFTMLLIVLSTIIKKRKLLQAKEYLPIKIFFIYLIITIIRSPFMAHTYYDWKFLFDNFFTFTLIISTAVFSEPDILQYTLKKWFYYAFPLFFIYALFFISSNVYGAYMAPLTLIIFFLPGISIKRRWVFIILALLITFIDISARSTVVKYFTPLLIMLLYIANQVFKIPVNTLCKKMRLLFLISPFILFILGVSGIFNVFNMDEYIGRGKKYTVKYDAGNGIMEETDLLGDTRTFIYEEVITSAINNNYVIWGRTLARGNDSASFGVAINEALNLGRDERQGNEVGIANIFTYMGIIGVLLYFFIFYKASYLAIYQSHNLITKLIGLYISFRWLWAWVEDMLRPNIGTITLWMFLAICFSEKFRSMNNEQIKLWGRNIFLKKHPQ